MTKKHEKTCRKLNYFKHYRLFTFVITGFVSLSAFAVLVGIPVGITSSAIGLKICTITAGIKKYESVFKNKKKHDKIVWLAKSKFDTIEVLISSALIDSYINHKKFVSVNNVLQEYNEKKRRNQKS